jgi:hypothetical protein
MPMNAGHMVYGADLVGSSTLFRKVPVLAKNIHHPPSISDAVLWYSLVGAGEAVGWQIDDAGHCFAFGRFR